MGGASADGCADCLAGSYSDSAGAATCTSCPAGSASARARATDAAACAPCAPSTYAPAGSSACSACPPGSTPDAARASCLVGVFVCPAGSAPSTSAAPTSLASCAPLLCAPPLALAADGSACAGCAANTSGAFPACESCAAPGLCPGLTAAPLVPAAAFASSAACPLLTGAAALGPALASRALAAGFPLLTGVLTVDNAIIAGVALASLALLVFAAARASSTVAAVADAALARFDAFAQSVNGAVDAPLKRRPRPIGGTCTLLGGIAFVTIALTLGLQRAADNVAAVESVVALTDARRAAALALPVFSAAPWGAGLQVRVTASGDGGVCASGATWAATDAGWALSRVATCAGSGASQLVFACADCALTPTSSLSISLHYSCQSLLVEAAAMDAAGAVTAFALPAAETAAAPGARLSTISWTLPTLLSVVNSTVSPSARGFTLTAASHAVAAAPLPAAPGGGLAVVPTAAAVRITIALPLNAFYASTVLSEKQSITALLSSIVGLAGIFGLFGSLLGAADYAATLDPCAAARARNARKAVAGGARAVEGAEARGGGDGAATVNPLRAAARWRRASDGVDEWFVELETGATAWERPEGAVLVEM